MKFRTLWKKLQRTISSQDAPEHTLSKSQEEREKHSFYTIQVKKLQSGLEQQPQIETWSDHPLHFQSASTM